MMTMLSAVLDRLLSQEVARTNAAREAMRLQHSRRQLDDVNAFLAAHHQDPARQRATATAADMTPVRAQRSRPEPP